MKPKLVTEEDAAPEPPHPPLDHDEASILHSLLIAAQTAEEMAETPLRNELIAEARRILRREHLFPKGQPPDDSNN